MNISIKATKTKLTKAISDAINDKIELETLATFDEDAGSLDMGAPALKGTVAAEVISQVKGDKVRVAKFKAKVRFRRVNGFRAQLTKIKIVKI
jgi:large subunit ribosomal protein L21